MIITIDDDEADYYEYTEYKLTTNRSIPAMHYVAYGKYVTYYVMNYVVKYEIKDDTGEYIDAYGDVYDYDDGGYCHYVNYGQEFILDAYGLSSDVDYDGIVDMYKDIIEQQYQDSIQTEIEHADYISYQALHDYYTSGQDETCLGVDAQELMWYETHMADTQYYVIKSDGTVEVLTLPPDPEEKASVWEMIWVGLAAAGVAVAGVILSCAFPGAGSVIGGAMIAGALDIFMQVTVSGTKPENIDVKSVLMSAAIGAITGGIGASASAMTKGAVTAAKTAAQRLFIEVGTQAAAGLLSGTITYLASTAASGREINFNDCLRAMAIGGATGIIAGLGGKLFRNVAAKSGVQVAVQILGGAGISASAYLMSIAITGKEFDLGDFALAAAVGAATAALMLVGKKIVSTVKSNYQRRQEDVKNRIAKNLPSDDNDTWSIVDKNGNKMLKEDFLKNPNQKAYVVGKYEGKDYKFPIKKGFVQFKSASITEVKFKEGFGPETYNGKSSLRTKYNMKVFDELAAEQWNKSVPNDLPKEIIADINQIKQNSIKGLSGTDIKDIRTKYSYTWHECEDTYTAQLVPSGIHNVSENGISHYGGVGLVNQMSATEQKSRIKSMIDYLVSKGQQVNDITNGG